MKAPKNTLLLTLLSLLCYTQVLWAQDVPTLGDPSSDPAQAYANAYLQAREVMQTDPQAATEFARHAIYYAGLTADSLKVAKACYLAGMVATQAGSYLQSFQHYARASEAFYDAGDEKFYLMSLWAMGYVQYQLGAYQESLKLLAFVEEDIQPALSPQDRSRYLQDMGVVLYNLHEYSQARAYYEKSLSLKGISQTQVATLKFYQASVAYKLQESNAVSELEEALSLNRAAGNSEFIMRALNNLGTIAIRRGNWEQAAAYLNEASVLVNNLPQELKIACAVKKNLVKVLLELDRTAQARKVCLEIIALPQEAATYATLFEAYEYLTQIDQALGDTAMLAAYSREQVAIVSALNDHMTRFEALDQAHGARLLAQQYFQHQERKQAEAPIFWWALSGGLGLVLLLLALRLWQTQHRVRALQAFEERRRAQDAAFMREVADTL